MSSEIYYDRAFIKVGDSYIPMVNQGSSNCFEVNWNGRYIPEKNWHVLNYRKRAKVIYTESEVVDIAEDFARIADESGAVKKSRYTGFKGDEVKRWIIGGMRSAHTVEEYTAYCNAVIVFAYGKERECYEVTTTSELFDALTKLSGKNDIDVMFKDNRTVKRPKRPKAVKPSMDYTELACFFVLAAKGSYLCKLKKYSFTISEYPESSLTKKFINEQDAERYLNKYSSRFGNYRFAVTKIERNTAI